MDAVDKVRIRLQDNFGYKDFEFFKLRLLYILNNKNM